MSTHKECGAQIRWARRTDDPNRWMPPLELAGEFYVFSEDGETAKQVAAYVPHECDPDQMIAWAERQIKIAQAYEMGTLVDKVFHPQKDELSEEKLQRTAVLQEAAREQANEEMWNVALTEECRSCGAEVNEYCENLTERKKGNKVLTNQPHAPRFRDAMEKKYQNEKKTEDKDDGSNS